MILLQHVTCCIQTNIQYNTVELCMYLQANSVNLHSYSVLLHDGIHTKMKLLFCDDHRNNVLLGLKFVFMTFKSQNDCICGTPTSPPSHPTNNNTPPFAKWCQFGTQKFNMTCCQLVIYVRRHIDVLGPTYCLPQLAVPLVVFQSFVK